MLIIRLARIGRKHQPSYRIIISENHKDTKGDYLEKLGFYNPLSNPKVFEINKERIEYWISKGAQISPTVYNLLIDEKIVSGPKKSASSIKRKKAAAKKEKLENEKKEKEKIENEKKENSTEAVEPVEEKKTEAEENKKEGSSDSEDLKTEEVEEIKESEPEKTEEKPETETEVKPE